MFGATNWTDVATAIAAIVTAAGVLAAGVAAWLAWLQVRELRASRDASTMLDISRRWDEPSLVEARSETVHYPDPDVLRNVMDDLKARNDPRYYLMIREPNFFEDLAIMVESRALDFGMIRKGFGGLVVDRWRVWHKAVASMRTQSLESNPEDAYRHFEGLAIRMAKELGLSL